MSKHTSMSGSEKNSFGFDCEEQALAREMRKRAENTSWDKFEPYAFNEVDRFYRERGLSTQDVIRSNLYRLAKELSNRLMVASGLAREPDYRDVLANVIRERYKTRREFCEEMEINEDMLSHVLARRRHFSMESLLAITAKLNGRLLISFSDTSNSSHNHPQQIVQSQ